MNCRIIIPSGNSPESPVTYLETIARIAGGFTAFEGVGGWIDVDGDFIAESVRIFDIHVDDISPNGPKVRKLRALCQQIAIDLNQEYVYFGIGENVEYTTQKD